MNELLNISPVHAAILVVALPFIAFVVQAIAWKRSTSGIFALVAIVAGTILSGLFVFAPIWQHQAQSVTYEWFTIGSSVFTIGFVLNDLSVLMQFVVCVIALPVHIYSKAYMKGDPGIHRYWMYLSLFCFAMLGLTISKNLFMMYVFWELVGFASYLLIGFWFTRDAAVQANKKAFIINRIGDLGFLIGIGVLFASFGTLDLVELFAENGIFAHGAIKDTSLMTLAGICFFIGAMAKSAQFPLHIWLPDAMEGPTSVSSLIHAATMVAAGVFLLSSIFPLFNDTVLTTITMIGTVTALSGAYNALKQYDIKRVLAFSTISQLGLMMVGVGIGAWDAAMFHLTTHAFFKCLLFLGAGAVIHEMSKVYDKELNGQDPQDLRNMGGLRHAMPKTFVLMSVAALALAGFPLTAGFLSKDALVISAFEWAIHHGGLRILIPLTLVLVSVMTAFYIGRLIFKTFLGRSRVDESQRVLLRDAAPTMWVPMLFLALGSTFIVFSLHPFSYEQATILTTFAVPQAYAGIPIVHLLVPTALVLAMGIAWWLGWRWYVQEKYPLHVQARLITARDQWELNAAYKRSLLKGTVLMGQGIVWFDEHIIDGAFRVVTEWTRQASGVFSWVDKHIVDGLVHGVAVLTRSVSSVFHWLDKYVVDGIVNKVAGTTYYLGHLLRWIQNGRIQTYLGFALTIVLIGIIYLILR